MKDDRIDFSPLDPSRDAARWEGMVGHVVARAVTARRASVGRQVRAWARPALAMAAAVAIAVWAIALSRPRPRPPAGAARAGVYDLVAWAGAGQVPTDVGYVLEVIDVH
jgi:hypothetical protein